MRFGIHLSMMGLMCAIGAGCGNRQEARQPEAGQPEARAETDEPQESGNAKAAPREESVNKGIADICDKLCQHVAQKCTKQVAGLYEASCRRYEKTKGKCENEVRLALECQLKSTDELLCAHQLDPNCSKAFHDLKACEKGTAPVEQTSAEDISLPAGWTKVSDTQLGFTVAMPPGAKLDPKSGRRTWQAEQDGITYIVAEIDPPTGKLNNPTILRTFIAYVGSKCQMHLRLHGQLEIKGTTVVQYDSGCPDGTEWHGMLHFWNGKAVSTGFHGPAGAKGVLEPYYYSFVISN